jgi:uncharacterized protein (TIGR03083 family)
VRDDVALLRCAAGYATAVVADVGPGALRRPTPCRAWDLGTLLAHLVASTDTLLDRLGVPGADRPCPAATGDAALAFHLRVPRLGCVRAGGRAVRAGALELAVHGWDVAHACGTRRPLPAGLAADLLALAPALVSPAGRGHLFAAPVPAPPGADDTDRLVAFLGRPPRG